MELLIRCHVLPQRSQTKPFHTEFLSAQRTFSLHYFSSGMHSKSFGIKTTQKLVVNVLPPLFQFWRCALEENVPAQDQGRHA